MQSLTQLDNLLSQLCGDDNHSNYTTKIMTVITIIVIISIKRHWDTNVFSKWNLLYLYSCRDFVELSTQTLNAKIMLIYIRKSVKFHFLPFPRKCALKFWYSLSMANFTSIMSRRQTTLSSTGNISMLMSLTIRLAAVLQRFFWRRDCFIAEKIKSARKETDREQWHPEVLTASKGNGISSASVEVFGCFTKARYYIHDVKSSL